MSYEIDEEHFFITLNGADAEFEIGPDSGQEIKFKNALLDGEGLHKVMLIKGRFSIDLCSLNDDQARLHVLRYDKTMDIVLVVVVFTKSKQIWTLLKGLFEISGVKSWHAVQNKISDWKWTG